jgi:hypothetical protein
VVFTPPVEVALAELPGGAAFEHAGGRVRVRTETPTRLLAELCGWAAQRGIELEGLELTRPTLEDIYLELVREPDAPQAAARAEAAVG